MDDSHYTLESFNVLGMDMQLRLARKKAKKLEFIELENRNIELYALNDFYIELIFRKELKIIKSIKAIDIHEYADKYIQLEDMNDL